MLEKIIGGNIIGENILGEKNYVQYMFVNSRCKKFVGKILFGKIKLWRKLWVSDNGHL